MATKREEITALEVATRWLNGETMKDIAASFGTNNELIRRRLVEARRRFPDLPWYKREARSAASPTYMFLRMRDGRQGPTAPGGSVVNARNANRRR